MKDLFGCELIGTGSLGFFGKEMNVTLTDNAPFAKGQQFSIKLKSSKEMGFFSSTRPAEILRPITAQVFGYYSSKEGACTINEYGKGKAVYLGFSPDRKFMEEMIDWLKKEQKLKPLMEKTKGVEVTTREGEKGELIFIVNHNFVPTTISLDGKYKDIMQDRILHGEISIAPQHSLILEKFKELDNW